MKLLHAAPWLVIPVFALQSITVTALPLPNATPLAAPSKAKTKKRRPRNALAQRLVHTLDFACALDNHGVVQCDHRPLAAIPNDAMRYAAANRLSAALTLAGLDKYDLSGVALFGCADGSVGALGLEEGATTVRKAEKKRIAELCSTRVSESVKTMLGGFGGSRMAAIQTLVGGAEAGVQSNCPQGPDPTVSNPLILGGIAVTIGAIMLGSKIYEWSTPEANGSECFADFRCASDFCDQSRHCQPRVDIGGECDENAQCEDGAYCMTGSCLPQGIKDDKCEKDSACRSGNCNPDTGRCGSADYCPRDLPDCGTTCEDAEKFLDEMKQQCEGEHPPWSSYDCQVLLAAMGQCPDPRVVMPTRGDDSYQCGLVEHFGEKELLRLQCERLAPYVRLGPDQAWDCDDPNRIPQAIDRNICNDPRAQPDPDGPCFGGGRPTLGPGELVGPVPPPPGR